MSHIREGDFIMGAGSRSFLGCFQTMIYPDGILKEILRGEIGRE